MNATTAKRGTTPTVVTLSSPTLTGGQLISDTHDAHAPGHLLATDHARSETQRHNVGGDLSPTTATAGPTPRNGPPSSGFSPTITHVPGGTMTDLNDLATDHRSDETQKPSVGGDHSAGSHRRDDIQKTTAPGTISDDGQFRRDTQGHHAVVGSSSTHPTILETAPNRPPSDGWLELRIWAEMFEDAQKSRMASISRAERGGVDGDVYAAYIDALIVAEDTCKLHLGRCYERVTPEPIRQWQADMGGVGPHSLARLLGHLGHPVDATPHHWEGTGSKRTLIADEPYRRTVGQLWQYCGHGAPGRIKKGATFDELAALGSPKLKVVVHLIAKGIVQAGIRRYPGAPTEFDLDSRYAITAYGQVYYDARRTSADKAHTAECVRCGPSGKPAQVGSPWSKGHQQAHALRIVGKEVLRDLWTVAGGAA